MKPLFPKYLTAIVLIVLLLACKKSKIAPVVNLSELTINEIHEGIVSGHLTAEQLVKTYLNRIEEKDSIINAITYINSNAVRIARELDKEYQKTKKLRPIHGIPLLVKDNINVEGIPTTAGSRALENYIPDENAFIIDKLVEAGAIVLAKTNMAEWAFSPMHSESTTAGITRNPYNTAYVPAGSSGGTGAAISANFGTIGLGTDTGNSIRGPSSHNALVGFRTTLGLVSRSAIVPLFLRNDVVGPMCRTVEDATKVLNVIAGYDPDDPSTKKSEGNIPGDYLSYLEKDGLNGARIGVLRALTEDIDPEILHLFNAAIENMTAQGAIIIDPIEVPNFNALRQNQWCATFRKDLEAFLSTYVKSDTLKTLEDVVKIGTNSDFAHTRLENYLTYSSRWGAEEIPCGNAYEDPLRIAFRSAIEYTMDSLELDAIIYPSWSHQPARIEHFEEEYKGDNNQVISPHTGQPAFTVPMGFTSKNLPAGIQFLGRMFDEPVLIRLAYSYEQTSRKRQSPDI